MTKTPDTEELAEELAENLTPEELAARLAELKAAEELRATKAREASERYRRKLGQKPRGELKPCGTIAAARRHKRRGEELDDACKQAVSDHNKAMAEKRKAKKTAEETNAAS